MKVCAEKDSDMCCGKAVKECQQMKPVACLVMFMHKYRKQRVPIVMLATFVTNFLVTTSGEKL
jgi:hypothetical protein